MKSSAFEGILLRATWPDDRAVPQDLLAQIIKQSIPAFRHARAVSVDPLKISHFLHFVILLQRPMTKMIHIT